MYCVPGDRICATDDKTIAGSGTYSNGNYIYSSLAGKVNIIQAVDEKTIEVICPAYASRKLPTNNAIVTCKVERITQTLCKVLIQCIGDTVLKRPLKALIRKEDVREKDVDNVDIYKCFRPGDIILSKVIGLSDNGYLLSTASNELGVVLARSEYGVPMVAHSWTEMICPQTKVIEHRKVAKIVMDKLDCKKTSD